MSALKRLPTLPRPRPAVRNRITIRQFRELMAALRDLPPDDDDWRNEVPAYPLPARRLIPADPGYIPF